MEAGLIQVSRIHRLGKEDSKLKAFVDVSLAGIVIKGLRVVEGREGLFVGLPQQKSKDGRWFDAVVFPKEMQQELSEIVLEAYKE